MIAPTGNIPAAADDGDARAVAYLVACGLSPGKAAACAALLGATTGSSAAPGPPVAAVMGAVENWARELGTVATIGAISPDPVAARARMLLAGVPARWPGTVLQGPVPPPLQAALRRVGLEPAPEVQPIAMTPQPIDLGPLSDVADETWRTFDKWPVLGGVVMWSLFVLLLAAALFTVRF